MNSPLIFQDLIPPSSERWVYYHNGRVVKHNPNSWPIPNTARSGKPLPRWPHLASRRHQFSVRCTICKLGAVQPGSSSSALRNAARTRAQMRLTSVRFSLLSPLSVEGSGQPCSLKSTSSVSSLSSGNLRANLTPSSTAESTQHGRSPQFMTRLRRPEYAATSASLMSSATRGNVSKSDSAWGARAG